MGRRYTSQQYLTLVKEIKEKIPDVALSTDIIVGFPNETYEQFLDTLKVVKEAKYWSAFTFIYSPRNNTPAAKIKDNVTPKEKNQRFQQLVKTLEEVIEPINRTLVGKTLPVLVEGPSEKNPNLLSGYTEHNKLVHFKGDTSLIGEIVNIKINESRLYYLTGELVDE